MDSSTNRDYPSKTSPDFAAHQRIVLDHSEASGRLFGSWPETGFAEITVRVHGELLFCP